MYDTISTATATSSCTRNATVKDGHGSCGQEHPSKKRRKGAHHRRRLPRHNLHRLLHLLLHLSICLRRMHTEIKQTDSKGWLTRTFNSPHYHRILILILQAPRLLLLLPLPLPLPLLLFLLPLPFLNTQVLTLLHL